MEVVEDFLYLISSSSANNIQVIKCIFTDIFLKIFTNIFDWKYINLKGQIAKADMVERGTKKVGENISRKQDNKHPCCQWHYSLWYWDGTNQGKNKQTNNSCKCNLFFCIWIWWHCPHNPNCSTGMDPSVGRASSTTYCAYT